MGRLGATLHYYFECLIKIFLVVAAVRAVLLLLKLPVVGIPYLDEFLYLCWDLIRAIIELISGSKLIPRF